jgi:hypothetical protein
MEASVELIHACSAPKPHRSEDAREPKQLVPTSRQHLRGTYRRVLVRSNAPGAARPGIPGCPAVVKFCSRDRSTIRYSIRVVT